MKCDSAFSEFCSRLATTLPSCNTGPYLSATHRWHRWHVIRNSVLKLPVYFSRCRRRLVIFLISSVVTVIILDRVIVAFRAPCGRAVDNTLYIYPPRSAARPGHAGTSAGGAARPAGSDTGSAWETDCIARSRYRDNRSHSNWIHGGCWRMRQTADPPACVNQVNLPLSIFAHSGFW